MSAPPATSGLDALLAATHRPAARPSARELLPTLAAAYDLPRLERQLHKAAISAPPDLVEASRSLITAGGKRVRPLLLLLAAHACRTGQRARGRAHLALAVELVHSATLLHDDVIDDGLTRRGLPAPRVLYGNGVSVIAGDWMLVEALEVASRSRVPRAMDRLLRALRQMVDGEARQLALRGSVDFSVEDALRIARLKTAALFAFCAEAGAMCAGAPAAQADALRRFGEHIGTAFQIADDLLDFEGDALLVGKAVMADVREGKASVPVAFALSRAPELRPMLLSLQSTSATAHDDAALASFAFALARTGALDQARAYADAERARAASALLELPESPIRELLSEVALALVERKH